MQNGPNKLLAYLRQGKSRSAQILEKHLKTKHAKKFHIITKLSNDLKRVLIAERENGILLVKKFSLIFYLSKLILSVTPT